MIVRIRTLDGRTLTGTPLQIVQRLRASTQDEDEDAYMRSALSRLSEEERARVRIEGEAPEERCESFLAGIGRADVARIGIASIQFSRLRIPGIQNREGGLP